MQPTAQPAGGTAGRSEFSTTDPDRAIDYLDVAYGTDLRVSGAREGFWWRHRRADGGSFAIDDLWLPLQLSVQQAPLGSLIIAEVKAGRFEREFGGVSGRFEGGDVFVDADPAQPARIRALETRLRTVKLDLEVLARVAATSASRVPGPIRLTGDKPISPAAARHWQRTIAYLDEVLGNDQATAQPLIVGCAARLLAATVLATFPNTALIDPTAQDRHDGTAATLRRAKEFIDEWAHTDISSADVAAAANVSIRAVQFAFRRHLDSTPMAYLRAARLDRAHEDLLAADPERGDTVTGIASRWGFYHPSRFTTHYRRAYGVTPRHTLHSR